MRNPDLISKAKKVKGQGLGQILIAISSLSLLSLPRRGFQMILVSLLQVPVRAAVYLPGRSQDLLLNWLTINIHFLGITVGFHAVHVLVHLFLLFMVLFFEGFGVRVGKPRGPRQPPPHWNIVNGIIH